MNMTYMTHSLILKKAHEAAKVAIDKYNNKRPHRSCGMLTPTQAHKQTGFLKKHWKTKAKECEC